MQKRPSQVEICTSASCRMVSGICADAVEDLARAVRRCRALAFFCRWNAARSSGGYSFVVRIVYSTAPKNAAAPT